MGLLGKLVFLSAGLVVLTAVGFGFLWNMLSQPPPPVPQLGPTYWGPGLEHKDDETIRPFKINISDKVLNRLQNQLKLTPNLTPPLEGENFRYGFNTDFLKTVVDFWLNKYNWREREVFLNSVPQFTTQVSGLKLHFLRLKPAKVPAGVKVLPLLLLHGWPGSVREFYSLIPLLTTPRTGVDFVFEVVAPSLPGYGFSEGASKPGLGAIEVAVVMKSLMNKLGFEQFYIQGGDWGSVIATSMAKLYPKSVLGLHTNMCFINSPLSNLKTFLGSFWPSLVVDDAYADRMYPLSEKFSFLIQESGYMHLQASKPDTVGVALQDSPIGLATYILEKFSTWTDPAWRSLPDGGLTKKYSLTDLLDNIMIYWVSGSITTSMRLYSETFNKAQFAMDMDRVQCVVPTACAMFRHELAYSSESLLKESFTRLVRVTHMDRGGHFAAFEEPQLLADDIWASVKTFKNSAA